MPATGGFGDGQGFDAVIDAVLGRIERRLGLPPGIGPQLPGWPKEPFPDLFPGNRVRDELHVGGVEFTQSTQHNGATTPGYGADNAVPLVAHKRMLVRVYAVVLPGALYRDLGGVRVTGELTLSVGNRVIYSTGPTRADGYRVGQRSSLDRTRFDSEATVALGGGGLGGAGISAESLRLVEINCPMNFVVPAYVLRPGRIHAQVVVRPVDPALARTVTASHFLTLQKVNSPRIALVRVNWSDAAGNTFSATDAQMLADLGMASSMYPFPGFSTTILDLEVDNDDQNFGMLPPPGDCNQAWMDLLVELDLIRMFTALFQLGDLVYAVVPGQAFPAVGPVNNGCRIGSAGGQVGQADAFAHELGHYYDAGHVNVPGDPDNDTSFPEYGGSPTSIGEVGVDLAAATPVLHDPATTHDIMSYNRPQWVSPYTYQKLLGNVHLHQSAEPRVVPTLRERLVVSFRVHRGDLDRGVEIRHLSRVPAPGGRVPRPVEEDLSPISLDLLDGDNQVLITHHCHLRRARASCGCGGRRAIPWDREPWLDYVECVEVPAGADLRGLRISDDGGEVLTVTAGRPPKVTIEGPDRDGDRLVLRVGVGGRARASVVLLFTADDGETWRVVAVDPADGRASLDASRLGGGSLCRFRALATVGLATGTGESETFELPAASRKVWVDDLGDCAVPEGRVRLAALVDDAGHAALREDDITWSSDLDGALDSGRATFPELSVGRHEIAVTVPDGLGGTVRAVATLDVTRATASG